MKKSMKKIRWFSLLLAILLLSINITPVLAQDYLFQVPAATVDITINPDGTATLDYVYPLIILTWDCPIRITAYLM
jgi:hypothetical protein